MLNGTKKASLATTKEQKSPKFPFFSSSLFASIHQFVLVEWFINMFNFIFIYVLLNLMHAYCILCQTAWHFYILSLSPTLFKWINNNSKSQSSCNWLEYIHEWPFTIDIPIFNTSHANIWNWCGICSRYSVGGAV